MRQNKVDIPNPKSKKLNIKPIVFSTFKASLKVKKNNQEPIVKNIKLHIFKTICFVSMYSSLFPESGNNLKIFEIISKISNIETILCLIF